MTTATKTALRWRRLSSPVTLRYLSRRIGRSQNGMARCSSEPFPRAGLWAGPGAGLWAGLCAGGRRSAGGRCRGPAPALAPDEAGRVGQAGALGAVVVRPRRAGGADREAGAPPEVARDRVGGEPGPVAAERPAPRDQLAAAPA